MPSERSEPREEGWQRLAEILKPEEDLSTLPFPRQEPEAQREQVPCPLSHSKSI